MNYEQELEAVAKELKKLERRVASLFMAANMHTDMYELITRTEAAALIGRTERQLDRICEKFHIEKIQTINGLRIRKSDLLEPFGLVSKKECNELRWLKATTKGRRRISTVVSE